MDGLEKMTFTKDMEVFEPLAYMSLRGVRIDIDRFTQLHKEVREKIVELQGEINEMAGCELNTSSSQQMVKVLYGMRGNKMMFKRATGRPTADAAALATLRRVSNDPIIDPIVKIRRLRKLDEDFLSTDFTGTDYRIRSCYNQSRTTTCRISSSDPIVGVGRNQQNIPSRPRPGDSFYNECIKQLKRCYIPDPGNIFWCRDLKQAEAIVVAYEAEDEQQISDFQNGIDTHCRTVTYTTGEPYEYVYEMVKAGDADYKAKRRRNKVIRHGFNYRAGARTIKNEFWKDGEDITEREVQAALDRLRAGLPMVIKWWYEIEDTLRRTRTLTTCLGRVRYFMSMLTDDLIREATAFKPQSTVADVLNIGLNRVYRDDRIQHLNNELLLQIHDAMLGQCPEDDVLRVSDRAAELMAVELEIKGRRFTIPSDLKIGSSWGDLKEME